MNPSETPAPIPAPASPRATNPAHNSGLDAVRLGAAAATIWLHSHHHLQHNSSQSIGRFTVPFFCFIAGFFLVRAMIKAPSLSQVGSYILDRAHRLYVPFLIWSAIYLAMRIAKRMIIGEPQDDLFLPAMFLTGTMYHLWFLPFLVIASALLAPVVYVLATARARLRYAVAVLLIAAGVAMLILAGGDEFPLVRLDGTLSFAYFFERTWVRSPALLWGIAAGLVCNGRLASLAFGVWGVIGGLALTSTSIGLIWSLGRIPLCSNLAGVGWAIFGLGLGAYPIAARLAPYASISFGVYLSHVVFTQGIQTLLAKMHIKLTDTTDWITFVGALTGSISLCLVLRRFAWGKWLMP